MRIEWTDIRAEAGQLLTLGLPLVGSFVAGFLMHMTDTLMLGWYAVPSLAAASVSSSLWFLVFLLGAGFGHAALPMIAAAEASGDKTGTRRITRMAFWLSTLYFVAVLPVFTFSGQILQALGQPPEVVEEGELYLRIVGFGLFFALIQNVMRSFLPALGHTRVILWVTLVLVVVNIGVNYALIFGNFGFPELGIRGAAIATILSQILTAAALAVYAVIKTPEYTLFSRIWKPEWEAFRAIFWLGVPISIASVAESGLFVASNILVGWIGTNELAAHGIALQIAALAFMFHLGMSQASTVRAGSAIGKKDRAALRDTGIASYLVAFGFGIIVVIGFCSAPGFLVGLFIDPEDPARSLIIDIGGRLLLIAALFQFVDAGQIVALSLLRGTLDTAVPMWMAAFSYFVVGIPASYLLAFPLGLAEIGIWFGLSIGLTTAAVLLGLRFWFRALPKSEIYLTK